MPRIISEKKKAESSDGKQGRRSHQKLKSYIVTQYLLKNTDEDHLASAKDIIDYLADFGILAERRSIYRDIQEINEVMYALENHPKKGGRSNRFGLFLYAASAAFILLPA